MPELQPHPDTTESPAPTRPHTAADPAEALEHLTKMSGTGSSFGQADYVAINGPSVIALLLGVATGLSLIFSLFLFIPVLAIILGIIAIRQVRTSNGTQTGAGLAVIGLVLALGLGGYVVTNKVMAAVHAQQETAKCEAVVGAFGEQLKAATSVAPDSAKVDQVLDGIYNQLMTDAFRSRFTPQKFRTVLRQLVAGKDPRTGKAGGIESASWNHERVEFQPTADGGAENVLMGIHLYRPGESLPFREGIRLTNLEGPWKIDGMVNLFPLESDAPEQPGMGKGRP